MFCFINYNYIISTLLILAGLYFSITLWLLKTMAGPSRNIVLGPWTQEELERLFGEELPDIDLIAGYVADNPPPTATEAGSSRYAVEDFTESQLIEGEEYVPNMQLPKTAPREVPPLRSSV